MNFSKRIADEMKESKTNAKGKPGHLQQVIYTNLLVDLAILIRRHSLYPKLTTASKNWSKDLVVARKFIEEKKTGEISRQFEEIRNALENHKTAKFNQVQKRSFLQKKFFSKPDWQCPSLIEIFLLMVYANVSDKHLSLSKIRNIFPKGNYTGGEKTQSILWIICSCNKLRKGATLKKSTTRRILPS